MPHGRGDAETEGIMCTDRIVSIFCALAWMSFSPPAGDGARNAAPPPIAAPPSTGIDREDDEGSAPAGEIEPVTEE